MQLKTCLIDRQRRFAVESMYVLGPNQLTLVLISLYCVNRTRLVTGWYGTTTAGHSTAAAYRASDGLKNEGSSVLTRLCTSYPQFLKPSGNCVKLALGTGTLLSHDPDWLRIWVPGDRFERYGRAVDEYVLPKGIPARQTYAQTIGSVTEH